MINYSCQEEFIAAYNNKYRPKFNLSLFKRTDDDIINASVRALISAVNRMGVK
jgi:hypothetical protein